ncbi:GNAT family N-acetyltransferase [Microlunatus sp. GCM10028923]|uniref:GNAT family N-acetyltransferase n=1 Tax=Microlunatus sp. GCM10028923 TaxID=3273400 RepID=UPI003607A2CE
MGATTVLTTARLELVPLDPDRDAESLHAMLGDPAMDPYGWAEPTGDVAETRERLRADLAGNGGWTWAVRLRPDDAALGAIGIFSDQGRSIRGLSWHLRRSHWGRGIMGEAAPVVVEHLLAQPGITGVEAWIDTRNLRSIGVARRAGLQEASRMARVYPDHVAQQVVMVRAAEPRDSDVVAVFPDLPVRDVEAGAEQLAHVLGLHVAFRYPDPPTMARLTVTPWAGSQGLNLVRAEGTIPPVSLTIDLGIAPDLVYERALAAGLGVDGPPVDQPWYRRTFAMVLPDGQQLRVQGPLRPERG